jgi:hypothetical protein
MLDRAVGMKDLDYVKTLADIDKEIAEREAKISKLIGVLK